MATRSRSLQQIFCFFTATVVLLCNAACGQDYTEEYYWNGQLKIPRDDREVIAIPNRIYIQLPNVSTPLDVRVREGVNTTFDCGLRIDAIMPSLVTRNVRTFWSLRRRLIDGGLEDPSNVTNADDGIEIYGNNDRFLRTPNPILASRAKQTNIGVFNCTVCYDQHSTLGGNPYIRTVCDSSSGEPNVIGYPPIINRNGSLPNPSSTIRIGIPICLDYASTDKFEVGVVCAPLPGVIPNSAATYTLAPVDNYFDTDVFSGEGGENNLVYVDTEAFIRDNVVGSITCNNSNRFGFDVETTVIQRNVTSTFIGLIDGSTTSQCPSRKPSNVICPSIGQKVNLNCVTNFMYPYNITSPDSSIASNRNLSFTVGPDDYGTYICTAINECNQVTRTIVLEQSAPAYVIGISDPQIVSSGSTATINVTVGGIPDDFTYQWLRNGANITGQTSSTLTLSNVSTTDIGVYTCTPRNSRGSRNSSSTTISVTTNLAIVGSMPQLISNFAPPVSSGYIVTPTNPRITLTNSGDLNISNLGPDDTEIYTLASPDHQGASIVIELSVLGPAYVIGISGPQTVSSGSTATINVTVGGIPDDYTYQWSRNGANITGQTSSTLTLSNVSTTDIGVYICAPRNSRGSGNSSNTTISVTTNLAIVGSMPQLISNFAPSVSSGYIVSPNNPRITLTNSGDLNVSSLGPEDTGTYTLASPDHQGASIFIELGVLGPAYVIGISGPQTVSSGSTATINVTVDGIPDDFTYQWSRNGVVITGQTSSTLTLSNVSTTDIGVYTCTPRNSRGSGNSSNTIISVTTSLSINGSTSQSIKNFAPNVSSGYSISPNNPKITLTESGHLITRFLSPEDDGMYNFSSPDHKGATLTINITVSVPKPRIIEGLTGRRTVIPCSNVSSTVRYEWQRDGTRLPGVISSSLVLSNTSYRHIGLYQCSAFNSDGTGLLSRIQLNVKDSRELTWLIPHHIPSVFPNVSDAYNCTPHPVPFNITLFGQFETTGLRLQDSKNYSCQSKDISGMLKLELIVQGLRPLRPKIIFTRIFDRESQFFYIEWTNVATQQHPVQRYVLSWRVTTGGGGTVVDKRQFHANNHTVTTPNNYYHLSYRRNEVFTLTVHATNEVGDGPKSSQWVFDVNKEDGASTGNRPASFPLWLIILIIAIGLLLCCICCICCLLCFCCCCCGKRRDYPAEERERKYANELQAYRKKGEEESENEDSSSDESEASIRDEVDVAASNV